jgi:hypothetical protein
MSELYKIATIIIVRFVKITNNKTNRGYWMSVSLIINLLNELNKIILYKPLASIILFYFKELNKLSIKLTRIYYFIYHIPKIKTAWSEKEPLFLFFIDASLV